MYGTLVVAQESNSAVASIFSPLFPVTNLFVFHHEFLSIQVGPVNLSILYGSRFTFPSRQHIQLRFPVLELIERDRLMVEERASERAREREAVAF